MLQIETKVAEALLSIIDTAGIRHYNRGFSHDRGSVVASDGLILIKTRSANNNSSMPDNRLFCGKELDRLTRVAKAIKEPIIDIPTDIADLGPYLPYESLLENDLEAITYLDIDNALKLFKALKKIGEKQVKISYTRKASHGLEQDQQPLRITGSRSDSIIVPCKPI